MHPWIVKYSDYIEHFKNEAVKSHSEHSSNTQYKGDPNTSVSSVFKINKILKNLFLEMQADPEQLLLFCIGFSIDILWQKRNRY